MQERGYPMPAKSSCTFCPYHDNTYWKHLRDTAPALWDQAVATDARVRTLFPRGESFLHRSLVPLPMVDLDGPDQLDLFDLECEGMCGV